MKLNQFIWNNYKESKEGQDIIKLFEEGSFEDVIYKFIDEKNKCLEDDLELASVLYEFHSVPKDLDLNLFYEYIIDNGLKGWDEDKNEEFELYLKGDYMQIFNSIEPLSLFLYSQNWDNYIPYFFQLNFSKLQKVADAFEIDLPLVPLRKNKLERVLYYLEFCKIFNAFKTENNLTSSELCAFLYDFAPKYFGNDNFEVLPEPTNIWLCGGAKSDYPYLIKANSDTTYFWQGNEDTKKGDIIIMYCLAPQSGIEFICRAVNDGVRDPFFHYYGSITLGNIQKIPSIHISQLKTDEHLKNLPIVKKNLQGVNGTQINNEDYQRILALLKEKGQDISILPKLASIHFTANVDCKVERDVELQIVEPFLVSLKYSENDWIRQLPVRMGRGERNYPDYVFFPETKKGYEKGKMLLETKFIIKNNRDLEETFQQAHSYALRLEASKIVICDKDFIWIYLKTLGSFDRTKYLKFNWQEVNNPDVFNKIKKLIERESLK